MRKTTELAPSPTDLAAQPFFYEIRVKGRLSGEQWSAWFDNVSVSTARGESILRGTLPDHAALYGLISRLRDLAVPLLAVNVLDAEARRKLHMQSRRYNLMINLVLILVYLLLLGGLSAITVFLTEGHIMHTALALSVLFAVVGGLSYAFSLWSGHKAWNWITYAMWPGSLITFFIYTAVVGLLPTTLSIAILLLLTAGGLIYLVYTFRDRAQKVDQVIVEWEALGDDSPRQNLR
jgi:hypothetical protein